MNILYVFLFIIAMLDFFTSIPFDGTEKSPPIIFVISIIIILLSGVIRKVFFKENRTPTYSIPISPTPTVKNKKTMTHKNTNEQQSHANSIKKEFKDIDVDTSKVSPILHNYQDDIPARLVALAGLLTKKRITVEEYERRRNNLISKSLIDK